ncbi:MAG: hypothetical protein AAF738_05500 [Bacteroidota bacterium]
MSQLQYRFLEQELQAYNAILSKAADAVLDQDVSNYPIFVAHQQEIGAGLPLIQRQNTSGNWSINVSTLEEFVTKRLISTDKIDFFKAQYKNPRENLCLFVLSELGASFIYIARKK